MASQTATPDPALTQMLVSVVEGKRKVVTSYKRKVNLEAHGGAKYEAAEFFASVEDYIDGETSPEEIAQVLASSAFVVKSTVLEQLGLNWESSEDGMAIEILAGAFGNEVRHSTVNAEAPAGGTGPAGGGPAQVQQVQRPVAVPNAEPPHDPEKINFREHKAEAAENRLWAAGRMIAGDDVYDNRQSKPKPSSFDYRHKATKIGFWEDDVKRAREAAS